MTGMGSMQHAGAFTGVTLARVVCDWAMVGALLLALGMGTFAALILEPTRDSCPPVPRLSGALRAAALAQLALSPLILVVKASDMANGGRYVSAAVVAQVLSQTHFGRLWLLSAPLSVLLAALAWASARDQRARAGVLALISAAILALWAASSHAIKYGPNAVAFYFVHEAAAGLWLGSLAGLWLAARDGALVERSAAKVSRLAGWCVALSVLSGAYAGYDGLGLSVEHLLRSAYGRVLIGKVATVGLVVAIGAYNRYYLLPALDAAPARRALLRAVTAESVLLLGVVGASALLASIPPPAHMGR